jgi:hypothetical protein
MPGSFDDVMEIDSHGCLSPAGPTGLASGETMVRLDFWVFQEAACMDVVKDPLTEARWRANPDPHTNHFGPPFKPGPAIAMGLMVKKDGSGAITVEQWSRAVTLK